MIFGGIMFDRDEWKELNNLDNEQLFTENLDDDDIDWDGIVQPTEEQIAFANEIRKVFQELVDSEVTDINEEFASRSKLVQHFNKHCIGERGGAQSSRSNVLYDFRYVNQYKERVDILTSDFDSLRHSQKNMIPSLEEESKVANCFRKFFKGNQYLIIPAREGIERGGKVANLAIHSYSTNVTTNYCGGNTIDLLIFDATITTRTLTLYPVDANYLENKLNNIISKFSAHRLRINH